MLIRVKTTNKKFEKIAGTFRNRIEIIDLVPSKEKKLRFCAIRFNFY